MFAGKWYNGQEENQTMYIGNKHSVLVGMARARQLRVKPSKLLPSLTKSDSNYLDRSFHNKNRFG